MMLWRLQSLIPLPVLHAIPVSETAAQKQAVAPRPGLHFNGTGQESMSCGMFTCQHVLLSLS